MKITLEFNDNNNFTKWRSDEEIARTARWVINNFLQSIEDGYSEGAPRRIEAEKVHANLMQQLKSQLTPELITTLKLDR